MIISTGDRDHQLGSHKQAAWGRFIIFASRNMNRNKQEGGVL